MDIQTTHKVQFNLQNNTAETHAMAVAIIARGAEGMDLTAESAPALLPEGAPPERRWSTVTITGTDVEQVRGFVSRIQDTFDWLGVDYR